jgi:hypothetical protein
MSRLATTQVGPCWRSLVISTMVRLLRQVHIPREPVEAAPSPPGRVLTPAIRVAGVLAALTN